MLNRVRGCTKLTRGRKFLRCSAFFFLALGLKGGVSVFLLAAFVLAGGFSAGFFSSLRRVGRLLCMILAATTFLWGLTTGTVPFWGPFSLDGLQQGMMMGIKMTIMILAGLIWLSTTKIEEMTAGLEKLGIPYPVAFAFSTAIRLVPWIVASCLTVGGSAAIPGAGSSSWIVRTKDTKLCAVADSGIGGRGPERESFCHGVGKSRLRQTKPTCFLSADRFWMV